MKNRGETVLETVLKPESDGLASWFLQVGPDIKTQTPSANLGGGQFLIVTGGTMVHNGIWLPKLSVVYISPDEGSITFKGGLDGLEALIMQFPTTEAADLIY